MATSTRNEIDKLNAYLEQVTIEVEVYAKTLRDLMKKQQPTYNDCKRLNETITFADIVRTELRSTEALAKEYYLNFGTLYRCKQTDPLGVIKDGNLYRLRHWNGEYIVCGEGFAINEAAMQDYFERVEEEDEQANQ